MAVSNSRNSLEDLILTGVEYVGEELGRGAYGLVYSVKYGGCLCAAKEIHQIFLQGIASQEKACIVKSFVDECRRCSSLVHPKIVRFFGVFYPRGHSDIPAMVMEKMDTSLTSYLKKPPSQVPLMIKATILLDVGRGLCYLHSQKPPIIHRDLSPNNILLKFITKSTKGDYILIAKIADLGVAKVVKFDNKSMHSKFTKIPGTMDFMPPESMADDPVYGTPMDVFSYGGIMLFVATHEWPTPSELAKIDSKTKTLVAFTEVERRRQYFEKFTEEMKALKPLVESLLSNDPTERPSMEEANKQIEQWNKYEPKLKEPVVKITASKKSATDVAKKSPKEGNSYTTHPWYVGRLSRSKAETRLKNLYDGVYLIRVDDCKKGDYAICIRWKQKAHHIPIAVSQKTKYSISDSREFVTIYDLVEYYQNNSLSLPHLDTVLKYAYYMVCSPPKTSLQLPWPVFCKGSLKLRSTQTDVMLSSSQIQDSSDTKFKRVSEMFEDFQSSSDDHCIVKLRDDVPPEDMLYNGVPLEDQPWYHGDISRTDAIPLLKKDGDYLVRFSNQQRQHVLTVMGEGVIRNCLFKEESINQEQEVSFLGGPVFQSISELLTHYTENQIPLGDHSFYLREAISKPLADHYKWLINHGNLILDNDEPLSQELSSIIYSATQKNSGKHVLVKTGDFVYLSDEQRFLSEIKLLQQFSHPNIVKMLEMSIDTEPMYMVLEMMSGGGFLSFLCTHGIHQTQYQLTKYSLDVALGMEYLASQNCLHRNLTARSCLVGNNNEVLKISDFSMCIQTEKGIYIDSDVVSRTPVRWTAPEDVIQHIQQGYRMKAPELIPKVLYDEVMCQCWYHLPKQRPTFTDIVTKINSNLKKIPKT
ncbi:cytoplasmic tyrosine-protein kinase BMX-like isoform X2 [Dysidea avara]|uniref:cytoplasmic tyrosine-protein kinase BMX-like isoform X2 n=1 Tax=Dysidea avara TaxID=196820 RepID=UPI00332ABB60